MSNTQSNFNSGHTVAEQNAAARPTFSFLLQMLSEDNHRQSGTAGLQLRLLRNRERCRRHECWREEEMVEAWGLDPGEFDEQAVRVHLSEHHRRFRADRKSKARPRTVPHEHEQRAAAVRSKQLHQAEKKRTIDSRLNQLIDDVW
jgi:hypothetical protein